MKKSTVTSIACAVSSLAATVAAPQEASAQLNVGPYGIQPGLETNYLNYQLSGRDLREMRGIAGCAVGFGAACNKTGAVLQELVAANNGPSYQELLMRAAGGEDNFRQFATFYGNNPNLEQIPYTSFWQDDNPAIVDGYRYALGQPVGRTPVQGLGQVTKNFYWAPLQGNSNALDPRSGLLNLKYAFGRLLLEEVAKIPDFKKQFQALGLEPELKNYYWKHLSQGMRALDSGNTAQLEESILKVLSMPYYGKGSGEDFGRPYLVENLNNEEGVLLLADTVDVEEFGVAGFTTLVPDEPEELAAVELAPEQATVRSPSFPTYLAALPLLALLFFVVGGDDGGNNSTAARAVVPPSSTTTNPPPGINQPPGETVTPGTTQPPGETVPPGTTQPPGGPVPPVGTPPPEEVKKVPEPSTVTPYVLLALLMFVFTKKHWRLQSNN
ncbi:hypothetical protein NUACC21_81800 [Scytonema sp. NUACC21]